MLVYVSYPQAFNCYVKFKRHLDKHLQPEDIIIYKEDCNFLTGRYINEENRYSVLLSDQHVQLSKYFQKAIIFEDENNPSITAGHLEEDGVCIHYVPLALTKVVNKYKESYDEYIGRGSDWGNPVAITNDVSREDAIEAFEEMFHNTVEANEQVRERVQILRGKVLGCFCKPQACHGDIIADYLNSTDDGK